MKSYILTLGFVVLALPAFVLAHSSMMDFDSSFTGPEMMRFIEDRALNSDELHEEMENLMVKMMTGELTETEANKMVEIMNQYPGPMGMMMNRMVGGMMGNNFSNIGGSGMMGWGYGVAGGWTNIWFWLVLFSVIIWLIVGVLAAIWLWKKIQEK